MAVDSVNSSNNNSVLYSSVAALAGGGAGAAAGWYSKPYLKDGAPTDSFIRKMDENIKEAMSPEEKQITQAVEKELKSYNDLVTNAKTVEELKNGFVNKIFENTKGTNFDDFKYMVEQMSEGLEAVGVKAPAEYAEKVRNAGSFEELKQVVSENFDKQYAGKSIDEVKNAIKAEGADMNRKAGKAIFEQFWDSSNKNLLIVKKELETQSKKQQEVFRVKLL